MPPTGKIQLPQTPATHARPLVLYDGPCDFCRWWVAWFRKRTESRVDYCAYQKAPEALTEAIGREQLARAVYLIEPDGRHRSGAEVFFRLWQAAGHGRIALRCYERLPGFAALSEWAYRRVAAHRGSFYRLMRRLGCPPAPPPA